MMDTVTQQKLSVSTGGIAGPYIMTPVVQLPSVRRVLDAHQVPYAVDEDAISLDGEPEVAVINLGRGVDAASIQRLLDLQP